MKFVPLSLLTSLLFLASLSESQMAPGTPSFSSFDTDPSGFTTINLQNLNVILNVPLMNKAGAFPLRFGLSGGDSYIYSNNLVLTPGILVNPLADSVNGWLGYYAILPEYSGSTSVPTCPVGYGTGPATEYTGWNISSVDGTIHWLPAADVEYVGANCFKGFTDQVIDGTGYTLSLTSAGTAIYASNGMNLTNGITDSQSTPNSITYTSQIGGNTIWTDTLGVVTLTRHDSPDWTWTDINGGTQTASLTETSYTLETAFTGTGGCPGFTDTDLSEQNLPTAVNLPDGTSLGLAWEPTPGFHFGGVVTGRLAKLTERDGVSTVSFNYNPSNLGIPYNLNCSYLVPNSMTRTTSDGTKSYTWAHTPSGNTTTVIDYGGNKTVYTFNSTPLLTEIQQYPNTGTVGSPTYSSSATRTVTYCYNGNSSSCPTTAVTLPVAEVDVYTNIGVTAGSSRLETQFDKYGNVTYSAQYDFGASSPTFATTTTMAVNGSGNCSGIGAHVNNKPCSMVMKDGSGNTISSLKYTYDAYGNLLTIAVSPNGGTTFIGNSTNNVYNANGTISKSYDLANNETDYSYLSGSYSDGSPTNYPFPTKVANATTGVYMAYTWDATGGVMLSATDANGNSTNYGYKSSGGTADPWWRRRSVTDPLSNETWLTPTATSYQSSFEFNSSQSIQNVTTTLDGYGRTTNTQKEQGVGSSNYDTVSVSRNFSGVNPTIFTSNPCTATSGSTCTNYGPTNTYDMWGRLVSSVQSGSNATDTITYSENDVLNVLGPAPSFDGENTKQVQTQYDGLGRTQDICHIGNGSSTACSQNTGSQNGVTDAFAYTTGTGSTTISVQRGGSSGQKRTWKFDGLGRLTQKATPEASNNSWDYTYDTNSSCPSGYRGAPGQLASASDPNGNLICYAYDALNRVAGVNANNTTCRHFYYDNSTGYSGSVPNTVQTPANPYGRLVEAATDSCSSNTLLTDEWFGYDADGRVANQYEKTPSSPNSYYHSYATFIGPMLYGLEMAEPSLYRLQYLLDGEGRFNIVDLCASCTTWVPQASIPSGGYNAASQPVTIDIGSGSDNDTFTYDNNTLNMTGWNFTVNSVSETGTPNWNPIGSLKSLAITDGFNSGGTQTCDFGVSGSKGYDDWNRILYDYCGTGGATWNQTFSYDQYDNLTKSSTGYVSWNPGYSNSGTGGGTNHYTCTGCTYDSNGDLTNDGTNAYAWNEFAKMKSLNISGANCASGGQCLIYDAFGRLVEIDSGSSKNEIWYTQIGKTAYMTGNTENYAYWPAPGGGHVLYNGTTSYYMHKDWLGNARIMSSIPSTGNGTVLTDRAFAPYGEIYDIFGSTNQNEAMFGGGLTQDVLSGMYDTPNRELQGSQQGRWLSPDPAGSGWNQYAYATNPNSFIDPTGLQLCAPGCGCTIDGCGPFAGGGGGDDGSGIGCYDYDPSCSQPCDVWMDWFCDYPTGGGDPGSGGGPPIFPGIPHGAGNSIFSGQDCLMCYPIGPSALQVLQAVLSGNIAGALQQVGAIPTNGVDCTSGICIVNPVMDATSSCYSSPNPPVPCVNAGKPWPPPLNVSAGALILAALKAYNACLRSMPFEFEPENPEVEGPPEGPDGDMGVTPNETSPSPWNLNNYLYIRAMNDCAAANPLATLSPAGPAPTF